MVRGAALALGGIVTCTAAAAAQSARVATIPANIPSAVRAELLARRAALFARIEAHNAKVTDFLPRCGPGKIPASDQQRVAACASEHQGLLATEKSLRADTDALTAAAQAAANAPCAAVEAQLERDNEAFDLLRRTMALTERQFRASVEDTDQAWSEAMFLGGKLLIKGAAKSLTAREELADKLWKKIEEDSIAIGRAGADGRAINQQIRRTLNAYAVARNQAELGADLSKADRTLDAAEKFKDLKTLGSALHEIQKRADQDLMAVVNDPTVRARASDLARLAANNLSEASQLARFTPHYTIAAFAVDYIHQGTKWALALADLEHQSEALGNEVQAMKALQAQVRRTTDRLKACKAGG